MGATHTQLFISNIHFVVENDGVPEDKQPALSSDTDHQRHRGHLLEYEQWINITHSDDVYGWCQRPWQCVSSMPIYGFFLLLFSRGDVYPLNHSICCLFNFRATILLKIIRCRLVRCRRLFRAVNITSNTISIRYGRAAIMLHFKFIRTSMWCREASNDFDCWWRMYGCE